MLSQEQIAEFEGRFPGLIRVVPPGATPGADPAWEVLVRPPSRAEYKRFRSRLRDPRWAPDAIEEMITGAVVYPDPAAFQALLERFPAACEGIANVPAVADMLGMTADKAGK